MVSDLIRLARPQDWLKSVFILMPIPFALAGGAELRLGILALGLVGFCLVTSAVYVHNDVSDAPRDRLHPRKQRRPVASGAVSEGAARLYALALLGAGAGLLAAADRPAVLGIAAAYVLLNLLYTQGMKNVPLLDIFLLASGFLLRVFLGCALVGAEPSNWLLLCSSTLALLLGLAKRRGDLIEGSDASHRPSLAGYNMAFLDHALGITAGIALLSYALYCIEAGLFQPGREFATLPFVAYGILETLRLAYVEGKGASPVELATSEPSLWFVGLGWGAAVIWSLGLF